MSRRRPEHFSVSPSVGFRNISVLIISSSRRKSRQCSARLQSKVGLLLQMPKKAIFLRSMSQAAFCGRRKSSRENSGFQCILTVFLPEKGFLSRTLLSQRHFPVVPRENRALFCFPMRGVSKCLDARHFSKWSKNPAVLREITFFCFPVHTLGIVGIQFPSEPIV